MPITHSSEPPLSVVALANIRGELARRQMSHRQLAGLVGVTPEYLSRRMRNEVPLAVDELAAIASVLELTPEALLTRQTFPVPRRRATDDNTAGAA